MVDRTPFDNNGDWILVDGVVRKLCEFLRKVLTNGVECGIIQEYFVKNTSGKNLIFSLRLFTTFLNPLLFFKDDPSQATV